jgi:hypothetical protein
MSNEPPTPGSQQKCCILGICCAPLSAEQETALTEYLYEAMEPEEYRADNERLRFGCRAAAKKLFADGLIAKGT